MAGELFRRWEPETGRPPKPVCRLCEGQAGEAGWVRADLPTEREGSAVPRSTVRLVA
jgi:hypothetical protein